jgi:hypothetical protein
MSQFNLRYVPTLSCNEFLLNGQRWNTQAAVIANTNTSALTTEVIINDDTKNQVLYAEIAGNIHGNLFPQIQAEIDALEANVEILQGNVVSLQNQINVLTGNVIIDEEAIAELIRDTQFLEAPYAGLAGNTSYFWRGLQVYNTPTDTIDETNGTGIFSYLDSAGPSNQIQLRAQDSRFISLKGSTFITAPSGGQVNISGNSAPMLFNVGNSGTNNVEIAMNGNINLKGDGVSRVSVYTKTQVIPIPASIKTAEIVGADEANVLGKKITALSNDGGQLQLTDYAYLFAPQGMNLSTNNGKTINIDCASGSSNSTITIGTGQGALDTGFKEISIGQSGPPTAIRKSSTFIHGDFYLDYGGFTPPNTGLWDLLLYQGLPTPFSGPTNAPVKTTVNPYFRSISTFCPDFTTNSFVQTSGTFSVLVGAGGIIMNTGVGGLSMSCLGGLLGLTSLVGGMLFTTAAGAIQMTTGAGAINLTTGAAPVQVETNIGDVLIKAGYAYDSTPELSLGSIYLQARDYTYITPDKNVVVGAGIEPPYNEIIANTITNSFFGNLFTANTQIGNLVYSNVFITPNIISSIVNPVSANLYYNGNIIGQTGQAQAAIFYANGLLWSISDIATVPYYGNLDASGNIKANIEPTKFTFNFTDLPLNANVFCRVQPILLYDANLRLDRYAYGTWQSNTSVQSNIGVLINAFLEPPTPSYDRYLTVLGNASFQSDVECNSNIIVQKDAFPALNTTITNNSISTTGNITCQTLNYTYLNPPIAPGVSGVESIIAGNNISISPLSGVGNVLINCILPNIAGGVTQIIAGNGIEISPLGGQGNVTVSLAGSVIPPGGYLPISGGIMTGEIYQYPSTGNVAENTYKLYRPQTSYQPPFPAIGPPTQTGELLTFFNGDNPGPTNFTGWFPQNTFQYEPDAISNEILTGQATIYQSTGGSLTGLMPQLNTVIGQFKVGDHVTSVEVYINGWLTIQGQLLSILTCDDLAGPFDTLYKITPPTPTLPYPTTWNIPIDFTYTGGQKTYNVLQIWPYPGYETPGIIQTLATSQTTVGDYVYSNFQGQVNIEGFANPTYFIGVQGDPTTSVLYEYFPNTGLTSKLLAVNKSGGVGKINGIYSDDSATSREIIVYGDFQNVVQGSNIIVVNNIFQYNIDTNTVIQLTTQTADPAYAGNLPKGLNGAVYGVEKQVSATASRRVWIWGNMTGVAQMGNPAQPTDCTLQGGCNATTSDNWGVAIEWDFNYSLGQGPFNCRGGRIINNVVGSAFLLLVYAGGLATNTTFNSLTIIYYNPGIAPGFIASFFPFANGSITSSFNNAVDYITIVDTSIIMTGEFTGTAQGVSLTDIPIYSIMRAPIGTFSIASGLYSSTLFEMANSGNATFWVEGTNQVGVSRIKLLNGGTTLVMGTYGYGTTTQGGGVLTFPFLDVSFVDTPAVKYTIAGIPPYTVLNIANDVPTDVLLSCSLNQDNYWFGQTFNSTLVPDPSNDPVVNTINGAKFLVDNQEMTKIVFSGNIQQNYSSVSFIAGSAPNDKNWYWYSQVGAIDYFAGNTFYPNICACPAQPVVPGPTTSTLAQVMINGAIASVDLNMFNHNITNANTIYSQNILTLSAPNAVEVGVGTRRVLPTLQIILDTLGNDGDVDFGANNYINSIEFAITATSIFQKNSLQGYFRYDDGFGGGSGYLTPSIIAVSGGGVIATGNQTLISSMSGQNWSFTFPNDVSLPVGSYFFKFTTDGSSSSYFYYGFKTANPQNVCSYAEANVYLPVNDPLDFFNVYGNSFYSDRITTYGDMFFDNPGTTLGANVIIDDTQMILNNNQNNLQITPYFVKAVNTSGGGLYSQLEYNVLSMNNTGVGRYGQLANDGLTFLQTPLGFSNTNQITIDGYRVQYYQSLVSSAQAQLIANSGGSQVFLSSSQLSGVPVGCSITLEAAISGGNFKLACNTIGGPGGQKQLDITNTGAINIQTTNNSLITLVNSSTQLILNSAISTLMGSTVSMKTPSDNNNFIVSTASQFHNSADVDDVSNPTLQIVNNNASTASYPVLKFNKSTTNTLAGNIISAVSSWARDYTGTSIEWNRIQTKVENNGVGNQDASLSIYNIVNGTLSETFNFNGGQNEINSFRPLDMNGNDIRSTTGNVVINSNISTGLGQVQIQTKGGTAGSGTGFQISGNTMTSANAGGSSGHHMCITLPDPTTGLPRVYKIALLNP